MNAIEEPTAMIIAIDSSAAADAGEPCSVASKSLEARLTTSIPLFHINSALIPNAYKR